MKLISFTLFVLLFFPGFIFGSEVQKEEKEILQQYRLTVTGLKCRTCIPDVRKSLEKVPGVRDAKVIKFDKTGSDTVVEVIPGSVSGEILVAALRASGFKAEVTSVGEPRKVVLNKESGFSFFGLF